MMLTVVICVSEETDPTKTDPHDVAEQILDFYEENASPAFDVTFVSAEWAE